MTKIIWGEKPEAEDVEYVQLEVQNSGSRVFIYIWIRDQAVRIAYIDEEGLNRNVLKLTDVALLKSVGIPVDDCSEIKIAN
jgi:hypothetical protein